MKLLFVETDRCPICGCDAVIREDVEATTIGGKSRIREHANGGRWETRTFACGYRVGYSPNFRRETAEGKCSRDPELMEQNRKRNDARRAVTDCISALDVDDVYKGRLLDAVRYI